MTAADPWSIDREVVRIAAQEARLQLRRLACLTCGAEREVRIGALTAGECTVCGQPGWAEVREPKKAR